MKMSTSASPAEMLMNSPYAQSENPDLINMLKAKFGIPLTGTSTTGQSQGQTPFHAWIDQPNATQGQMPNYSLLAQQNYQNGQNSIPKQNMKPYFKA